MYKNIKELEEKVSFRVIKVSYYIAISFSVLIAGIILFSNKVAFGWSIPASIIYLGILLGVSTLIKRILIYILFGKKIKNKYEPKN